MHHSSNDIAKLSFGTSDHLLKSLGDLTVTTEARIHQLQVFRLEVIHDRRARVPAGKLGTDHQRLAAREPLLDGR